MTHNKTVLPNGLRVVTTSLPYAPSISVVVFIGAGSRYETSETSGIFHFIEHICFKGTQRRPTPQEISEAIEGVGGVLNGGTDKEITVYWTKVAKLHFEVAVDVLQDMVLHSRFEPAEVEKERNVIVEEISMSMDAPQQRVDLLIDEVVWPDQALGRDVAGSKDVVRSVPREALLAHLNRQYVPNNAVIAIAGAVEHEQAVSLVSKAFGGWQPGGPLLTWQRALDGQAAPRVLVETRKTEQTQLALAVRGLSMFDPDRYVLDLLNVVLGEGMSSRLFIEIREKRCLAYDIHSYVTHLLDTGTLNIGAGVDPKHLEPALRASMEEMRRLKNELVPPAEVTKAKEFTKGRMLLRMEDSRSVAGWLAAQELLLGRIMTVEEVLAIVDRVTAEDIQRVARRVFIDSNVNLAVVGPAPSEEKLKKLLHF